MAEQQIALLTAWGAACFGVSAYARHRAARRPTPPIRTSSGTPFLPQAATHNCCDVCSGSGKTTCGSCGGIGEPEPPLCVCIGRRCHPDQHRHASQCVRLRVACITIISTGSYRTHVLTFKRHTGRINFPDQRVLPVGAWPQWCPGEHSAACLAIRMKGCALRFIAGAFLRSVMRCTCRLQGKRAMVLCQVRQLSASGTACCVRWLLHPARGVITGHGDMQVLRHGREA